jgi:hypothetical protein
MQISRIELADTTVASLDSPWSPGQLTEVGGARFVQQSPIKLTGKRAGKTELRVLAADETLIDAIDLEVAEVAAVRFGDFNGEPLGSELRIAMNEVSGFARPVCLDALGRKLVAVSGWRYRSADTSVATLSPHDIEPVFYVFTPAPTDAEHADLLLVNAISPGSTDMTASNAALGREATAKVLVTP